LKRLQHAGESEIRSLRVRPLLCQAGPAPVRKKIYLVGQGSDIWTISEETWYLPGSVVPLHALLVCGLRILPRGGMLSTVWYSKALWVAAPFTVFPREASARRSP